MEGMRDLLDDDIDDCMGKKFLAVIVVVLSH